MLNLILLTNISKDSPPSRILSYEFISKKKRRSCYQLSSIVLELRIRRNRLKDAAERRGARDACACAFKHKHEITMLASIRGEAFGKTSWGGKKGRFEKKNRIADRTLKSTDPFCLGPSRFPGGARRHEGKKGLRLLAITNRLLRPH